MLSFESPLDVLVPTAIVTATYLHPLPMAVSFLTAYGISGVALKTLQSTIMTDAAFIPQMAQFALTKGNTFFAEKKVLWLSPLSGITLITLFAHYVYGLSSNPLLQGTIYAIHNFYMLLFASSTSDILISLKKEIAALYPISSSTPPPAEMTQLAERISAATLLTFSLCLTIWLQNPILANGLAYTVAAFIAGVAPAAIEQYRPNEASSEILDSLTPQTPRDNHPTTYSQPYQSQNHQLSSSYPSQYSTNTWNNN